MSYEDKREQFDQDDYILDERKDEDLSTGSIILYGLLSMMLIGLMFYLAIA